MNERNEEQEEAGLPVPVFYPAAKTQSVKYSWSCQPLLQPPPFRVHIHTQTRTHTVCSSHNQEAGRLTWQSDSNSSLPVCQSVSLSLTQFHSCSFSLPFSLSPSLYVSLFLSLSLSPTSSKPFNIYEHCRNISSKACRVKDSPSCW